MRREFSRPVLGEAEGESPSAYSPDGAGAGQGQDGHRPGLDLRPRRPSRSAATDPPAALFYASRDRRGEHPAGASGGLRRHPAGRRLRRLQPALSSPTASPARSSRRRAGRMRGASSSPWPTSRRTRAARPQARRRSPLSPIAIEVVRRIDALFAIERPINGMSRRGAPGGADAPKPPPGRRSRCLHARAARRALARARPRQGDPLHAHALAGLHPLPRRRADLPLHGWC